MRCWYPLLALPLVLFAARLDSAPGKSGKSDWPQWQGANRTAMSAETDLLESWPKGGPKLLWNITGMGAGFSTPSVAAGRIFTMGNKDKIEYVIALDESDGKALWQFPIGDERSNGGGYPGPRCTPAVEGNRLYALGLNGDLVCLDVTTGQLVWRRDLRDKKELDGHPGGWGYTESPLIDGDKLLITPGGKKNTIVALKKTTGELIWSAQVPEGDNAGYSSIAIATIAGTKQYVQFMQRGVVSVEAETGKYLWRHNGAANGTANISTPVVSGDYVFSASAYGKGGALAKITRDGDKWSATEVYFTSDMQNHHGGMILLNGYLYGNNGGKLACLEFKTGKVMWQSNIPGKGSIAFADGCLYYRNEGGKGTLYLVEANPEKFVERGRFDQPDRSKRNAWAHPVIANGRLYIADQDALFCCDVKK
jgi:outer membrane protein assembly factor BamB